MGFATEYALYNVSARILLHPQTVRKEKDILSQIGIDRAVR